MKHDHPDKIIFLDIDGVICTPKYHFSAFDPDCIKRLEDIIDATNASIVISSSWRDHDSERMKKNFFEHGFTQKLWDKVIGITCRGYHNMKTGSKLAIVRGNEIKTWIDTHLIYPWHANPELDDQYKILNEDGSFKIMESNRLGFDFSYVILDDDTDMLYDQRNHFVNTTSDGLTDEDVTKAIQILNYK